MVCASSAAMPTSADQVRYDDLVEGLKRHYRNTEDRDLVEVEKRLKHLDPFFTGTRAAKIDAAMVSRYVERRKKEHAANGTINRELGILTRSFRLAVEAKRLAAQPVVHKLEEASPRSGFFEPEEFEQVRKSLPEDLPVAETLAYTHGWRMQSECSLWRSATSISGRVRSGSTRA